MQELRNLAAGLQPAALAGGGLLAAVADLAARVPLAVRVDVVDERFASDLESAAWFVVAEAVTNAVKHSGADQVDRPGATGPARRSASRSVTRASAAPTPRAVVSRGWPTGSRRSGARCGSPRPPARHERGGGVPVRVVIADDSALLREGLSRLMAEAGVEVCAAVGDAAALEEAVREHEPDVAVVDIRMPPTFTHEGAAAAVALRDAYPDLGILLLSQAVETHFAAQLLTGTPSGSATCSRTA